MHVDCYVQHLTDDDGHKPQGTDLFFSSKCSLSPRGIQQPGRKAAQSETNSLWGPWRGVRGGRTRCFPRNKTLCATSGGQKTTNYAEHHWFRGEYFTRLEEECSVCGTTNEISDVRGGVLSPPFHTVAMMTSRWAMSLTLCSRSGAMRARFSLENSHDGKMWIT